MSTHSLIRPLTIVVVVAAMLLSVPLVAMQFTDEVNWSVGDFLAGGTLLLLAGTAIVLVARRAIPLRSKLVVVAIILALLLLVWARLAVGLFA